MIKISSGLRVLLGLSCTEPEERVRKDDGQRRQIDTLTLVHTHSHTLVTHTHTRTHTRTHTHLHTHTRGSVSPPETLDRTPVSPADSNVDPACTVGSTSTPRTCGTRPGLDSSNPLVGTKGCLRREWSNVVEPLFIVDGGIRRDPFLHPKARG